MNKKPIYNLLVFALVAFNFMFLVGAAEVDSRLTLADELQQVLDTELVNHNGIGVSAAVIIPGQEPWVCVVGVSHGPTSITPDMLFGIGSITKNFVVALILQLAEEGKLSLEDQLKEHLPIDQSPQIYGNINGTTTIQRLLNHTSGIYNFFEQRCRLGGAQGGQEPRLDSRRRC